MRATLMATMVVLGMGAFASPSLAQDTGFSDPFFLYYGFYLPRQAALAAQAQPDDFVRAQSARRQEIVQSERSGLYEPIRGIGLDDLDPTRPFGTRSGSSRTAKTPPNGISHQNLKGTGPREYFSNHRSYYPGIRTGRSAKRAPAIASSAPRMGGYGMSLPSATAGVPINTNIQSPLSGRR